MQKVLDLGCGDGDFFLELAQDSQIATLVGIDPDATALARLRHRLMQSGYSDSGRIALRHGTLSDAGTDLTGFDCAVLIEVIEHIPPEHLSGLERALFGVLRPWRVILSTPNAEFNPVLGVPAHRLRHPGHRFEWTRARFRDWARGVAARHRLAVGFRDIGHGHPDLGSPTQMAVFARL